MAKAASPFDGQATDSPANDPFAKAKGRLARAQAAFDQVITEDFKGRLLLIQPTEYHDKVVTKFTKPGEDGTPAVTADAAVLDGDEGLVEFPGTMIFAKFVVAQLRPQIGKEPVLGVLVTKPSQKGHDAWFIDSDVVTDEQFAAGIAYLDAKEAEANKGRLAKAGA